MELGIGFKVKHGSNAVEGMIMREAGARQNGRVIGEE